MKNLLWSSFALAVPCAVLFACSSSSSSTSTPTPTSDASTSPPNDASSGGNDASSDAVTDAGEEFGCAEQALNGCVKGTAAMSLTECDDVPPSPSKWSTTVTLGAGDEGVCLYYAPENADPSHLDFTLEHPAGSTAKDKLLVKIVGFDGPGVYDVNDVRNDDSSVDVNFQIIGTGGQGPNPTTTAFASQGCPACKVTVTARKDKLPAEAGAFADYDISIACGGELGLGEGSKDQGPSGNTCSQSPAVYGVCKVTSQSFALRARCRAH